MLREFLLISVLPVLVLSQNVTVATQNPSMHFDGTWVVQDSGGHEFTTTIGSSVSLNFTGTAVYWHATINPRCGIANVSVDNDAGVLIDASNGTNTNSTPIPAILFARSGLDPGRSHLINISLFALGELGGPYMEMYNLTYTQDNSASITSGSAISSTETNSSSNTGVSHKKNIGPVTGGVIGGVLGVLLILCLTGLIFRRQMQSKGSLTTPYTGARSSITGMPSKSVSINVPPRPTPQPQPPVSLAPPPTVHSETIPSANLQPEAIAVSTQLSVHPVTLPDRNAAALSAPEDPPPPYIPRRS